MNWRKQNRWLHRKLGYLFFGMAIIYGVSGIALNHHIVKHWNPSHIERTENFQGLEPVMDKEVVNREYIETILEKLDVKDIYKQYYLPRPGELMIYLKNGHIMVDLEAGTGTLTKLSNRRFFREVNFLHYNKPKKLWTYFSDLFALSMIILAISGIIMAKGKRGLWGVNGLLVAAGILIPLIFLIIYLW